MSIRFEFDQAKRITYRHENIRIISVRRARKKEINLYESAQTES